MNDRHGFKGRLLSIATLTLVAATACKPWTVRPIEDRGQGATAAAGRMDAAAYVDSIWATRVLQEARTSAVDMRSAAAGTSTSRSAVFVRGTGTVARVDVGSRVGLAFVDLAPGDGRPDVSIQIGPVLRGTTVRDALPFIQFGDFANQLAFADVANALNARVLSSVLGTVDAASLEGRHISFWGATRLDAASGERLPEVVPVILEGGTT